MASPACYRPTMPDIQNGPERDGAPQPKPADSATMVWLKLVGLLAGLLVFGGAIFWLSKIVHHG